MLAELEDLARESSSDKRRELLNAVTTLFLDGAEEHSDREAVLYADVVLQVLEDVELDGRVEYATAVAHRAEVPVTVARRLAHDEIEVARPVLQLSPVLDDLDLIKVAERRSQGHLAAISVRPTLSTQVTDSLVRFGDDTVMHTVSGNPGARFSGQGLKTIVVKAADDETLRDKLAARADLREELMEKVLPLLSQEHVAKLRLLLEDRVGDGDATLNVMGKELRGAADGRLEIRHMLKEILAGTRDIDDTLVKLSEQGRIADVAMLISRLTGIRENVVSNVMFKAGNEPVAIVCRAMGASEIGFRAVQELRARRLRLPTSHIERGAREFSHLSVEAAKRSLRFVKMRAEVA